MIKRQTICFESAIDEVVILKNDVKLSNIEWFKSNRRFAILTEKRLVLYKSREIFINQCKQYDVKF